MYVSLILALFTHLNVGQPTHENIVTPDLRASTVTLYLARTYTFILPSLMFTTNYIALSYEVNLYVLNNN